MSSVPRKARNILPPPCSEANRNLFQFLLEQIRADSQQRPALPVLGLEDGGELVVPQPRLQPLPAVRLARGRCEYFQTNILSMFLFFIKDTDLVNCLAGHEGILHNLLIISKPASLV